MWDTFSVLFNVVRSCSIFWPCDSSGDVEQICRKDIFHRQKHANLFHVRTGGKGHEIVFVSRYARLPPSLSDASSKNDTRILAGQCWYRGGNSHPTVRSEVLPPCRANYTGECRWNYIAHTEGDAYSSPTDSDSTEL